MGNERKIKIENKKNKSCCAGPHYLNSAHSPNPTHQPISPPVCAVPALHTRGHRRVGPARQPLVPYLRSMTGGTPSSALSPLPVFVVHAAPPQQMPPESPRVGLARNRIARATPRPGLPVRCNGARTPRPCPGLGHNLKLNTPRRFRAGEAESVARWLP